MVTKFSSFKYSRFFSEIRRFVGLFLQQLYGTVPVFVKKDKPRRRIQIAMVSWGFSPNHIVSTSQKYKKYSPLSVRLSRETCFWRAALNKHQTTQSTTTTPSIHHSSRSDEFRREFAKTHRAIAGERAISRQEGFLHGRRSGGDRWSGWISRTEGHATLSATETHRSTRGATIAPSAQSIQSGTRDGGRFFGMEFEKSSSRTFRRGLFSKFGW